MRTRENTAEPVDTRERIFAAGVRLFARRGYEAVGIREIAAGAGANIAGVNYHYGGKLGLLKAILERYADGYWSTLAAVTRRCLPVEQHVHSMVAALVRFYRDNTELAVAAENSGVMRIPEVNSLVARLRAAYRESNNRYFIGLGLDIEDQAAMTVMRAMLTNIIAGHFHARFEHEVVAAAPRGLTRAERLRLPELSVRYDDGFYARFTDKLAAFYLGGVRALRKRPAPRPGAGKRGVRP